MHLARELGLTLTQIGEMDSEELTLWLAYTQHHHPQRHTDWLAGMLASVVANCHSSKGGFTPEDFVPWLRQAVQGDAEAAEKALLAWAANVGEVRSQKGA